MREKRVGKILGIIFVVLVFVLLQIGVQPVIERFTEQTLEPTGRLIIYENTIDLIKSYPLFGTGVGTYIYAYTMFQKKDVGALTDHAHNDYLELLADAGLIGGSVLILFVWGVVFYLFVKWRKRRNYFVRGVVLGCILGLVALLIHSISDFNFQIPANTVYFITLMSLGLRTVHLNQETRHAKFEDLDTERI